MKTVIVAALALCLNQIQAHGQGYQDSVNLASTNLTLGMPQVAVIAALAREYEVQKLTVDGREAFLWGVKPKKPASSGLVALVRFANGRLDWVSKFWVPEDEIHDFEFVTRLHWVLSELANAGPQECTVLTDKNHGMAREFTPVEWKSISITCGGSKSVNINVYRSDQGRPTVRLDEVLQERK
jgi:hypothetical protein